MMRLETVVNVVKLEPGAETTSTSWYKPHHMVLQNGGKNVFNYSFQLKQPDEEQFCS